MLEKFGKFGTLLALIIVAPVVGMLMLMGMVSAAAYVMAVSLAGGVVALVVGGAFALLCRKIRIALIYPVVGVTMGAVTLALMMQGWIREGLIGILLGLLATFVYSFRYRHTFVQLAGDANQHQTYVDASGTSHTFVVADDRISPEPFNRAPLAFLVNLLSVFIFLSLLLLLLWNRDDIVGTFVHVCWAVLMVIMACVMLIAAYVASRHEQPTLFLLATGGFLASLLALSFLQQRGVYIAAFAVNGWTVVFAFIAILTLTTGVVAFAAEQQTGVEIFSQCLSTTTIEEAKEWANRYCPQPFKSIATVIQDVWATMKELCTVTVRR
jgi:hypothetical protein